MNGFVRVYDKATKPGWVIEVKNLSELIKLYEKYGSLIIQPSFVREIPEEIIIYDGYVE